MGQAKRRGTYEERRQQAIARNDGLRQEMQALVRKADTGGNIQVSSLSAREQFVLGLMLAMQQRR